VSVYQQPLIINNDQPIQDIETVRLVLKAIFRDETYGQDLDRMADQLFKQRDLLTSHRAISVLLKNHLLELSNTHPGDRNVRLMLLDVLKHEAESLENARAFDMTGRENPAAVWWPDPTRKRMARSIYDELPLAKVRKIIRKDTAIASAGSCFAAEIAYKLQEEGYNYVITEPHIWPETGLSQSSARWGIIFNAPSFRQLIEKSFGLRQLPRVLFSQGGEYRDPFREDVVFDSVEEYEEDYERHTAAAREALLTAKVFVMTLGMNEVWYLKTDGSVFARSPWRFSSALVEKRVLTAEENVRELQRMLDVWRAFNPDLKIILSVSPVPLHATFRADDYHVIAANAHSKAILRVAAEQFASQNRDVYYFPSFETVTYCSPEPWDLDQRHVSRMAVKKVMRLFSEMFVEDSLEPQEALPSAPPLASIETKRHKLLVHPAWRHDFPKTIEVLERYLSTFTPDDDVTLVLWLPTEEGCRGLLAEQMVANAIADLGYDPDHIPDLLILQGTSLNQRAELLKDIDAVIQLDGIGEIDTLRTAKESGIEVFPMASEKFAREVILMPVARPL
jgi:hypothetical protein